MIGEADARVRLQVRYLQEGARVHKTELEWQGMKLQHQAEADLEQQRSRHLAVEQSLKSSMDDITCASLQVPLWGRHTGEPAHWCGFAGALPHSQCTSVAAIFVGVS